MTASAAGGHTIPHNFAPREYQRRLLYALDSGYNRAVVIWHRRAGKDITLWNHTLRRAWQRVGNYAYVFPTAAQGRKALWKGISSEGFAYLDHCPKWALAEDGGRNETEMLLRLRNGSTVQIVGARADNDGGGTVQNIRGSNPVGLVLSEYSQMSPMVYDVIDPILAENGGWLIFNTTPYGENHALDLFEFAKAEPGWYWSLLTIDDTRRHDGRPVIDREYIEAARRRKVPEEFIQQEYYCSFTSAVEGSYYGRLMDEAERERRIGNVPYDPANGPVYTSWDLGARDMTAIWFFQVVNREFLYLDFYQNYGEDLAHYAVEVLRKPYREYAAHYLPHDAGGISHQTAKTDAQILNDAGLRRTRVVKVTPRVGNRIELVRARLPLCRFDVVRCRDGIKALRAYRREWNDTDQTFRAHPVHDWASHPADAFGCGHEGWREPAALPRPGLQIMQAG